MIIKNPTLRTFIHDFVQEAEKAIDGAFARPVESKDLIIVPYRGYGTRDKVRVLGRVLRDRGVSSGLKPASKRQNLIDTVKRLMSAEVPGVKLRLTSGSSSIDTESDEEGYIDVELPIEKGSGALWEVVRVELLDPEPDVDVHALAECLIPSPEAEFGIISDIDDTVVETGATNKVKMFATVALNNAKTRTPFDEVGSFYHALQGRSSRDRPKNPLFYVSSGPWNFFDLLEEFFRINEIPLGPVLLQDFGVDEKKLFQSEHDDHKLEQIESIMSAYPDLPFVLIGDSGQRDPEIYTQVLRDEPGRVKTIYIRDVTPETRDTEVRELAREAEEQGVALQLVEDTASAWNHARETGLTS